MSDDSIDFSDGAMFAPTTRPLTAAPPRAPAMAPASAATPAPLPPLVPRCAQCGHAYGIAYHTRSIYVRGRGWRDERFCSERCGADYQMGCEG